MTSARLIFLLIACRTWAQVPSGEPLRKAHQRTSQLRVVENCLLCKAPGNKARCAEPPQLNNAPGASGDRLRKLLERELLTYCSKNKSQCKGSNSSLVASNTGLVMGVLFFVNTNKKSKTISKAGLNVLI